MPHHYYIDTDYLYSYIFIRDSSLKRLLSKNNMEYEIARCENFKNILFNKNKEIFIKIPFIVFGELFNNINSYNKTLDESNIRYINKELFSLFEMNNVDSIPPNEKCYKIANQILESDSRFDPTDALIVSQALVDKNSKYMATFDNTITNSFGGGIIAKINDNMCSNNERNKKLKIYE